MHQSKLSTLTMVSLFPLLLLTSGCMSTNAGASHRPIIDGKIDSRYETDLQECSAIASQRDYLNDRNTQNTVIGAVAGGVLGRNRLGGALVGAAAAATGSALVTRSERKNIVINCMSGRGYKTLESTD